MALFATVSATAQMQKYVADVKDFSELKVSDGVNVIWKCNADSAGLVTFTTYPQMAPLILLENKKNQLKLLRNPGTLLPCSKGTQTVLAGYAYPKQISIIP